MAYPKPREFGHTKPVLQKMYWRDNAYTASHHQYKLVSFNLATSYATLQGETTIVISLAELSHWHTRD